MAALRDLSTLSMLYVLKEMLERIHKARSPAPLGAG